MKRTLEQDQAVVCEELGLNSAERFRLIQDAVKVLYITEYAVLIEYTEVITPVVCSTYHPRCTYVLTHTNLLWYYGVDSCSLPVLAVLYMTAMFYLPNRAFYPQFTGVSQSQLSSNISNLLLYAALEFLSFLALGFVIRTKLGISTTRQLTFVLKTQ